MITKALREKIASFSSGKCYTCPRDYFELVEKALGEYGITLLTGQPTLYNQEGRGMLFLQNKDDEQLDVCLFFTWYRMEQSGNWEMVGYLT